MGYLCLTLPPTVYVTLLITPVIPPPNPGSAPVIHAGAIGHEAASLQYAYDAATIAFTMFQNMDRNFGQQLLEAVEDNFVYVIHRSHRGYIRSSMLDLLTTYMRRTPSSPARTGSRTTSPSEMHRPPPTP